MNSLIFRQPQTPQTFYGMKTQMVGVQYTQELPTVQFYHQLQRIGFYPQITAAHQEHEFQLPLQLTLLQQ